MTTWNDVITAAPDLAERTQARFDATGLALVATLRRDGAPRISGVEPFFGLGHLWLGMMPQSRKAKDLQRDPRFALHAATIDKYLTDGDAKVSGTVTEVLDADERAAFARAVAERTGFDPSTTGEFHLFQADLSEVVFISLAPEGDAIQIERWAPGAEVSVTRLT